MPSDVLITPASSKVEFTDGNNATKTLRITGTSFSFNSDLGIGITSPTSKLNVLSTTSLSSVFKAEGVNGTLFEVTDDLSNSLMSVNTIGGLPVFEVFANNTIVAGQYNANDFVISGNKVGVGTASPVELLDIAASANNAAIAGPKINFKKGSSNKAVIGIGGNYLGQATNTDDFIIRNDGANILFGFSGAEKVRFQTDGNVGIGAINPNAKLDIEGTGGIFLDLNSTNNGSREIRFQNNGVTQGYVWCGSTFVALGGGNITDSLFTMVATGNVGIGNNSPNNKLAVSGSVSVGSNYNIAAPTNGLIVEGNVAFGLTNPSTYSSQLTIETTQSRAMMAFNTALADAGTLYGLGFGYAMSNYNSAYLSFYKVGNSSTSNRLSFSLWNQNDILNINGAGNVGIGITIPTAKLHINSATSGATLLRADGTNGTLFSVVDDLSDSLMSVNNSAGLPVLEVFADDRVVAGQYGQNDLVVINNKVGLGTNNPVNKLSVLGSVSIGSGYNTAAPTNGLIVQGDVGIGVTSFAFSSANRANLEMYGSGESLLALRNSTGNSYIQKSGADFYINNVTNGFIAISNNGSERWRITNAGVLQSNNAQTIQTSTGILTLATAAGNGHIILSPHGTGNVGIGTATPSQKLEVSGLVMAGTDSYRTSIYGDNSGAHLIFGDTSTPTSLGRIGAYNSLFNFNSGNGDFSFQFAGSEKVRITNTGLVGIGTTIPTGKLTIFQGNNPGITLFSNNATQYAYLQIGRTSSELEIGVVSGSNQFFTGTVTGDAVIKQNSTGKLHLGYASAAPAITIDSSNNVGVGIINPTQKLHVVGTALASTSLRSPVFYDSDNDNFYCDPASNSILNTSNIGFIYPISGTTGNDLYAQDLIVSAYHHGDSLRYDAFQFNAPNTYETRATIGSSFVSTTVDTSIFKGDSFGGAVLIPYGTYQVRWTWNDVGYRYFNLLYLGYSATGHTFTILVEKSSDGVTWTQQYTSGSMAGWPAHGWYVAPWSNSGVTRLRITLTPTWNAGYPTFDINLYNMRYFCTYPLNGVNRLFDWDYSRNITFNGNVGIGLTNPTAKLDVTGSNVNGYSLLLRSGDNYNGTDSVQIAFGFANQTNYRHSIRTRHNPAAPIGGVVGNNIDFYVWKRGTDAAADLGSQFVMTMQGDGNVGIGVTNPVAVLNVKTSTQPNREVFMGDSTAVAGVFRARLDDNSLSFISLENRDLAATTDHGVGIRFNLGTNASDNAINAGGIYLGKEQQWTATASTQDSYLAFATSLDGTANEKVRIKSDGNVGIGITNPAYKLDVNGTCNVSDYLTIKKDLGFPISNTSAYFGYSGNVSSSAGSLLELVHSLSGSIGVNDPLRFRSILSAQESNDGVTYTTEVGPPSYSRLIDGNASSNVDIFTFDEYNSGIRYKRFVVDIGSSYRRPNFITIQSDYGGNLFYGYTVLIERSVDNSTWTTACSTQTQPNNSSRILAFNLGDLFDARYIRFTFGASQAITSGGVLKINCIRSYSNQYYSSEIPVFTDSSANLYSKNSNFLATASGSVGIGITSPITKLHVYSPVAGAGSERTTPIDVLTLESENTTAQEFTGFGQAIVFRGSTYNNNTQRTLGKILHQINDDSVSTTRGTSLDFQLLTDATGSTLASRMYIKYDGNVGIGTNNPGYKLDVNGDARLLAGGSLRLLAVGGIERGTIQANDATGGGGAGLIIQTSNGEEIVFKDSADINMVIKGNGSVGIGTTTPSSKLHISNAAAATRITITDDVANGRSGYIESNYSDALVIGTTSGVRSIRFAPDNSIAMTIAVSTNNVGIGTTNPSQKLDIVGSYAAAGDSSGILKIRGGATGADTQLNFGVSADGGYGWIQGTDVGATNNININLNPLGGNIGIGNIAPNNKLAVSGSASIGSNYNVAAPTNGLIVEGGVAIATTSVFTTGGTAQLSVSTNTNAVALSIGASNTDMSYIRRLSTAVFQWQTYNGTNAGQIQLQPYGGNVGIGLTAPTAKLNVLSSTSLSSVFKAEGINGTLFEVTDDLSNSLMSVNTIGGLPVFEVFANNTIIAGQYNANDLVITGNKIGIGTATPSYKLDVNGESSFNGVIRVGTVAVLNEVNSPNDIYANIRVIRNRSSTLNDGMYINYDSTGTTAADIRFYANGQTERMRIRAADGNVGIGTSIPVGKFDVRPDSSWIQAEAFIVDTDGGNNPRIRLYRPDGGSATTAYPIHIRNDSGNLNILTGAAAALGSETVTSKFYFTAAGNLGIGTTAPSYLLSVNTATDVWHAQFGQVGGNQLRIGGNTTNGGVIGAYSDNTNNNPRQLLLNRDGGNVAVGASSANNKLHVNGSTSIGSGYNTAGPTDGLIVQGSVGIGVTSPDANAKLHVYGNDAHKYIFYTDSAGSSSTIFQRNNTAESVVLTLANTRGPSVGTDRGTSLNLDLGYGGSSASAGTLARGAKISAFSSTTYTSTASTQNAYLAFYTALAGSLTEKMRIDSNGNVGIGTVSPSTTLHLNSTTSGATLLRADGTNGTLFSVVDDLSDSLMSVNNSAGLPVLEVFADDRVVAGQYGKNDFVINANKIGIGTANPTSQLEVGNVNTSGTGITVSARYDQSEAYIRFRTGHPNNSNVWETANISATDGGNYNGTLSFRTAVSSQSSPSTKMTILPNGNVGIGTAAPATLLQINTGTPTSATGGIQFGDDTGTRFYRSAPGIITCSGTIAATFSGNLTGNVTGNVSGTAGGETLGTVTGRGASTGTQISVATSAGGSMYTGTKAGAGYSDGVSGATFKSITDHPTGGSYAFAAYYNGSSGTNSFFVAADGSGYLKNSLGIGTSTPAATLQVWTGSPTSSTNGIQFGDDTAARIYRVSSSTIQVSNNLTVGGTLTESSSIRYKENIKTISAPILSKLEGIRPVTYNKKDNVNNTEYGIIAEELNEIFPEFVNKNDNGEIESVNYSRLTVLLIKAVKELKQEIDILKNK